jgi:hypothetical protein
VKRWNFCEGIVKYLRRRKWWDSIIEDGMWKYLGWNGDWRVFEGIVWTLKYHVRETAEWPLFSTFASLSQASFIRGFTDSMWANDGNLNLNRSQTGRCYWSQNMNFRSAQVWIGN